MAILGCFVTPSPFPTSNHLHLSCTWPISAILRPESKLHKRHVALSFHRVREAIAANLVSFIHIEGASNPADIVSKHWGYQQVKELLRTLLFTRGDTAD